MKISVLLPIVCLGLPVLVGGCNRIDPFEKPGVWQPMGANDMNFELQVARPGDLAEGRGTTDSDGDTAAQAVDRLRHDKVKPLVAVGTQSGGGGSSGGGSTQ
jgi:type IV pilus biogenesis protein CpaD/CtpE